MILESVDNPILGVVIAITAGVLAVGMLMAAYRLIKGPSLPDRVISLDLIGTLAVGVIALYTIVSGRREMLSVAIVMALILFLGTAAFATYLHRRARP
ncbi:MAG: monovalent cation/H+ antiporter complex subunit F [Planctomycetota bacterium]